MFSFLAKNSGEMLLIVGLGNPGEKYSGNRHNIGFMVIDAIADQYNFPPYRSKFHGELSEGRIAGQKVALLKPQTFMNNSGQSVKAAAKFFKIPIDNIIVLHDELDLEPGKVRIKHGGGNAGHNGLKSIQSHTGTADFVRVRLGIGHPGDKSRVQGYVLKDFAKADQDWLEHLIPVLAENFDLLVKGQESDFLNRIALERKNKIGEGH